MKRSSNLPTLKKKENQNALIETILVDGRVEKVQRLLQQEQECKANVPNDQGCYPICAAASHANGQVMKLLLEHGADLNIHFRDGAPIHDNLLENPCLYIYIVSSTEMEWRMQGMHHFFLEHQPRVNDHMLVTAIRMGNYLAVKTLLEIGGIHPRAHPWIREAVLIQAEYNEPNNLSRHRILQILLDYKFGTASDVWDGYSMLHLATTPEQVTILLEYGADHHWKDKNGQPPYEFHFDRLQLFSNFVNPSFGGHEMLGIPKKASTLDRLKVQQEAIVNLLGDYPAAPF